VVVSYHRQEKKISIADSTPVVTFVAATQTDVLAGAPVLIPAEREADETLAAGFVVVGANGVALPMYTNRCGARAGWALSSFRNGRFDRQSTPMEEFIFAQREYPLIAASLYREASKSWRSSTPLTLQGIAHDQES
jgi:hypothetical protein